MLLIILFLMLIVLFRIYFIILLMIYFAILFVILRIILLMIYFTILYVILRIVLLMIYFTIGFVIMRTVLLMMQKVLVSWIRLDDCFMFSLMKMIEIYRYFFQKRLYEVLIWSINMLQHSIVYLNFIILNLKVFTYVHYF